MSAQSSAKLPWLLALDFLLILVFATIGRASHAESVDALGVITTAWPFLVGAVVGHVASRAWRNPARLWPTGVVVWISAVAVGMLVRIVTGAGTDIAFVIVATITLAVFLLGWRAITALVRRATSRARATR